MAQNKPYAAVNGYERSGFRGSFVCTLKIQTPEASDHGSITSWPQWIFQPSSDVISFEFPIVTSVTALGFQFNLYLSEYSRAKYLGM